jgi:hypothetical protein
MNVGARQPQIGDVGFARTKGVMGWLIRLGTWLKFRKARFNHQFAIDDRVDTDGTPFVIQATMRGVTNTARFDEIAPGGTVVTMAPPDIVDRAKFLEFLHQQVGLEYGFITDTAMAIDIVTWDWVPSFRGARKNSWQCSALINEALRFGGWLHPWVDIYAILPDEGFDALTGTCGTL